MITLIKNKMLSREDTQRRTRVPRPASKLIKASSTGLLFGLLASNVNAGICEFNVSDDWNSGFRAHITITNDGTSPIDGWEVTWAYDDNSTIAGWSNANVTGNNPYTATNVGWNGQIDPGASVSFGFNNNKAQANVPAPSDVLVTGVVCGNAGSSSSSSSSSSNSSSSSSSGGAPALWKLDPNYSSIKFVTVKKEHTAEIQSFDSLDGTIDDVGEATFMLDLNSVNTNNDIRDPRMRDLLFETGILPNMFFTVDIDTVELETLATGTSELMPITGTLSLHGINQALSTDVLVSKINDTKINVSTAKPILIDSKNFDLNGGVEALRTVANLDYIGEVVPVYFSLDFDANSDPSVLAINVSQPEAPSFFEAVFDEALKRVSMNWWDNASDETGFIIRRKDPNGFWKTAETLASDIVEYEEGLPLTGEYTYKVIAYNSDYPSNASAEVSVGVSEIDPAIMGKSKYEDMCQGCHGDSGQGTEAGPALDEQDLIAMTIYIEAAMPLGSSGACDGTCAEEIASYIDKDFWGNSSNNDNGDFDGTICDDRTTYAARQLKLLSSAEYQSSVEDLIGIDFDASSTLPSDAVIHGFVNNIGSGVTEVHADAYFAAAENIAKWSADRNFAGVIDCNTLDQTCANRLITEFAPKIYRRPLSASEATELSELYADAYTQGDTKIGMELALTTMLYSPTFLYRSEQGVLSSGDVYELTPHEVATHLAYTFTGSTPDDELLSAATANELSTDEEVANQVDRLLMSPRGKVQLGTFVEQWLGANGVLDATKDPSKYPELTDDIRLAMSMEIRELFAHVVLDDNQPFGALFNADYTFVNNTLASYYGISGPSGDAFSKVAAGPYRGGLLTTGAFLTTYGHPDATSPIQRAASIRRNVLCHDIPPPPPGVEIGREEGENQLGERWDNGEITNRERYTIITEADECQTCHAEIINPLGFGLEDFDTIGRYRVTDINGHFVDPDGTLYGITALNDGDSIPFTGAKGLTDSLADVDATRACVMEKAFRYVTGTGHTVIDEFNSKLGILDDEEQTDYACTINDIAAELLETQDLKAAFKRLGSAKLIRFRKEKNR